MITEEPSPNGPNGRGEDGRFLPGNSGGPGNPWAAQVAAWRRTLVNAITQDDIQAVATTLVMKAKAGEPWAVKLLLERCLGKPQQAAAFEDYEAQGEDSAGDPSFDEIIQDVRENVQSAMDAGPTLPGGFRRCSVGCEGADADSGEDQQIGED